MERLTGKDLFGRKPKIKKNVSKKMIESGISLIISSLQRKNIGSEIIGVTVGPTVIVYKLSIPVGIPAITIINLIESDLYAEKARAYLTNQPFVFVEIPHKVKKILKLNKFLSLKINLKNIVMPIGKDSFNKTITYNFEKQGNLLISGVAGAGKTAFMHSMTTYLINTYSEDVLELYLLTANWYNEFEVFKSSNKCHLSINKEQSYETLKNLLKVNEERLKTLEENNVYSINEYNNKYNDKIPSIVVFFEEFYECIREYNDCESVIIELLRYSRFCGIYFVLSSASHMIREIKSSMFSLFNNKISFILMDEVDSIKMLGGNYTKFYTRAGEFFYNSSSNLNPVRVLSPIIDCKEIDEIIKTKRD